ncbi:UNVERIFIED_CONTAM: hypothetical protein FKN15_076353 [Acipenser sinensis]
MLLRLILLFYTLQVGSSVNLTCDIEDMSGKCFSVIWFKLRSKRIPTLETYQSVRSGGSFVGNEIEKTCSLNLNNAQVNDSGTYYCAFIRSPVMYLGNGSTLVVRERSDDRAYIEILTHSESDGEVQSSGAATLVCLVFGVSEPARVYWVIEGDVEYELTDSGSRDSSESTPDFIRNQITIPGEVWSSGSVCTCVVETESGRDMSRSVSKTGSGACPLFLYGSLAAASFLLITLLITLVICYRRQNKPDAYLANERSMYSEIRVTGRAPDKHIAVADAGLFQYPPLVRVEVGSSVNLTCDIEDMIGKCFSVIWFKLPSKRIPTLETYQSVRPGGSFVGNEIEKTCSLNLNNAQVNDSGTYYCAFIRSSALYTGNGSTLVVRERSDDRAYIEIITPSDGEVQSSGAATLVCLVFGVSEQARVYWVIEHGLTDSGSGDSSESTPDFIRNQITIPGEVWSSGSACTCVVETESGRHMSKRVSNTAPLLALFTDTVCSADNTHNILASLAVNFPPCCSGSFCYSTRSKSIPTLETYQSVRPGGSFVGNEIEKTCSLNLNNAQLKDSGTYYCAFIRSSAMYLGNGSTLVVRERSDDRPYIEILTPSESDGEVQSSGAATLVCLVFGVSEPARVYWVIEEDVEYELTDSGSRDSSESTPDFIRNQITIPGEVWSSGAACTCVVETESGRHMSKSASNTGSGACPLFLYGSLAAASFLLITLLITLVICYRRQNKPVSVMTEYKPSEGVSSISTRAAAQICLQGTDTNSTLSKSRRHAKMTFTPGPKKKHERIRG